MKTNSLKKTISMASLIALSSTAFAAGPIESADDALDQLTGPNQPTHGRRSELCVSVSPYFLTSMTPNGVESTFISLQIDGVAPMAREQGDCALPTDGKCERGFIKISSTVPMKCNVPIGL